MSNPEKMNALDFVIKVLRGHEKSLDSLIGRLKEIIEVFSEEPRTEVKARETVIGEKERDTAKVLASITCSSWSEFKKICSGADVVVFNQDSALNIKAIKGKFIYRYREELPAYTERLRCGIPVRLQAILDFGEIKRVISRELNIPQDRIIKGEIHPF